MITCLVRIGNSRGIRIPRSLLEQAGLTDEVDLEVREGALMIRSHKQARAGWDEAFVAMARHGDDALEIDHLPADGGETKGKEDERA